MKLVYSSNKSPIGDGTRVTKVWTDANGVQHFEIMVDPKTGKFSEVEPVATTNAPPVAPQQTLSATVEAAP